jgi:hypothetical protein
MQELPPFIATNASPEVKSVGPSSITTFFKVIPWLMDCDSPWSNVIE